MSGKMSGKCQKLLHSEKISLKVHTFLRKCVFSCILTANPYIGNPDDIMPQIVANQPYCTSYPDIPDDWQLYGISGQLPPNGVSRSSFVQLPKYSIVPKSNTSSAISLGDSQLNRVG